MKDFIEKIKEAVDSGADKESMWKAVDVVADMMDEFGEEYPDRYDYYVFKLYEAINGCHFDEELAKSVVEKMHHKGNDGKEYKGQHWSVDDVLAVSSGKPFSSDVTKWDKYVAYNAAWHDFSKKFTNEQIIEIAYLMFFDDEDWDGCDKVWKYVYSNVE